MRWAMLLIAGLAGTSVQGQTFELVEPSGQVTATVHVDRARLTVIQTNGERFVYDRERRYDSRDDAYAGFVNVALGRVVRFPRSGEGRLQTADLDDAAPRFRYTQRSVRPAAAVANANPQVAWPPRGGPPAAWPPLVGPPLAGPSFAWPPEQEFVPGFPAPVDPYLYPPSVYPNAYFGGPRYPQSLLIDTRVVPNPPLPPATVELYNGGRREIEVGLVDLQNPAETRSMRIAPGQASQVEIQRDSGGQEIQTFRSINAFGDAVTQNIARPIAPQARYEVVVHEWAMQSIAIDRTGKSPNPIEDINFQGRGLGRFLLPPGDSLQSPRIDVYRTAVQSGLAGTVAPIVPTDDNRDNVSPLERAILEAQQRAQRK